MRYRCQLFEADGSLASNDLIEEGESLFREDDAAILARSALHTLQYNFTNGTKVILGPAEYDCILCGSYEHSENGCPENCDLDSDDPFDERDYDGLPAVDES